MLVKEDLEFRSWLINKIREREFGERVGVHQSDLNYCLNKMAFRRLFPSNDTDQELLLYSLGWATQRWLTSKDEDEPEREVDGIKVTLDCAVGVDDTSTSPVPWELKCTYQSSTRPIVENVPWLRQIMAQCYVSDALSAKLTRFCIMGNWTWVWNRNPKPEKLAQLIAEHGENWAERPTLQAYELQFTPQELKKNWAWFLGRKKLFSQVIETGKPLPKILALPSGQAWECEYCKYGEKCGEVVVDS